MNDRHLQRAILYYAIKIYFIYLDHNNILRLLQSVQSVGTDLYVTSWKTLLLR